MKSAAIVTPTCPHLGLRDDPRVFYSYPSPGNCCYHCRQPESPLLEHQQAYCLSGAQNDCPVYGQAETEPFPAALRAPTAGADRRLPTSIIVAVAIVIFLLALGYIAVRFSPQLRGVPYPTPSPAPTIAIASTATPIPPTSSPIPTSTVSPTLTAPPPAHKLEATFEVNGLKLLMHRVAFGDTFETVDVKFDTTADVTRSLNLYLPVSLRANSIIVLAPGVQTVDAALPSFTPHEITGPAIAIDQVALEKEVDAALLRLYNGCTSDCTLAAGDWIIIPISK